MRLFHRLLHFNFAPLGNWVRRLRNHPYWHFSIDLVIILKEIFFSWWAFWAKSLRSRADRFFSFFHYLNWPTIKRIITKTGQQRLYGLAAEIAFNAMLALFPGLLAIIAAIGLSESLRNTLNQMGLLLGAIVPDEVRDLIGTLIDQIILTRNPQLLSFSFIGSLWIYSGAISTAMNALDQIHQVPSSRVRPFWQARLVSLGIAIGMLQLLIMASGLVILSDLVVEALARKSCLLEMLPNCPIEEISHCLKQQTVQNCLIQSHLLGTWNLLMWPITLGIVSLAFAFIYRYGPSHRLPYSPVMPGAIIAAILWAIISNLFRLYVLHFGNYNWTFGAIGTFIILQLWLHLSSFAMLLGAQINVTVTEAMQNQPD